MKRTGLRAREHVLLLILGLTATAVGLEAQGTPKWRLRLEGGQTEIHRGTAAGGILGAVFGRAIGEGHVQIELGLAAGSADEGFLALTAGPELRLFPHGRITPIGTVQVGLLAEAEYVGAGASVGAGLLVRPTPALAFRGAVTRGTHGGQRGPHAIVLGVEVSFGDR
ncbi:MAG: hypothetical protein KY466_11145 [Gemmatimonadetes bacterium]|nr:hypothetical protein [Gemmatimonadota bacterium]